MVAELPMDSYAWQLEAAVWVKSRRDADDELRCRPRLFMVHRGWLHTSATEHRVIGFIEYVFGGISGGAARWLVHHYPQSETVLWAQHDETKYDYGVHGRKILDEGETCEPRDSAEDALKCLLEITAGEIPRLQHQALTKVSKEYRIF